MICIHAIYSSEVGDKIVDGWNETYCPGEDTLICEAIRRLDKILVETLEGMYLAHH